MLGVSWPGFASLTVAVAALLFTIASFWFMNVRRGKLKVSAPHAYALASNNAVMLLRLPLAIYNTGARAIIVRDLRCWFGSDQTAQWDPLPWRTTRKTLKPESDDVKDFPTPFPVRGREAATLVAEFGHPLPGFSVSNGKYRVRVQVLDDASDSWYDLVGFDLFVNVKADAVGRYIAYRNLPPDEEERARLAEQAEQRLDALRTALDTRSAAPETGDDTIPCSPA